MELKKKTIRMDGVKYRAGTQVALEDDRNLPDTSPDLAYILAKKGKIRLEEAKAGTDHVTLKGHLNYDLLYQSEEEENPVSSLSGSIPFEEQVHMEGIVPENQVNVEGMVEDLSVGIINSRKISIQSVLSFRLCLPQLYEEEIPVEITGSTDVECCYKKIPIAGIRIRKKDIYRIREDMELSQNLPNIGELLWYEMKPGELRFKPAEEKILIQGEMKCFLVYTSEEEGEAKYFSTVFPINGALECQGSTADMTGSISYEVSEENIEIHEDADGEYRLFGAELVLDIKIGLYLEETVEIVNDCYGIGNPIEVECRNVEYKTSLNRISTRCRMEALLEGENIPESAKVIDATCLLQRENENVTEKGLELYGSVDADFLLQNPSDGGFYCISCAMPYHATLEASELSPGCTDDLRLFVEQLTAAPSGEKWQIRGNLLISLASFKTEKENMICEIHKKEKPETVGRLPGMIGYVVKEGDSLWSIGKKYGVSGKTLKEMNHCETEELKKGEKLLIVKQI